MRTNALVVIVILLIAVVICAMMMTVTGECVRSAEYEAAQAESAYNKNLRIMARDLDSALQAKQTADDSKGIPDGMTITYVGTFDCTAYDINCDTCGTTDITASGAVPEVGITCAADWGILPAGTVIYISGVGIRVVQDRGELVQGKTIDVLVGSHAEAETWAGYGPHEVYILEAQK